MKYRYSVVLIMMLSLNIFSQTGEEYYNEAYQNYRANDYKNALINAKKAIEVFEEDDDLTTEYYYAIMVAGYSYAANSNFLAAIGVLEKGIKSYEEGEDGVFNSLISQLAGAYQSFGNYSKAEELWIKSNEISENLYGKMSVEYAQSMTNLAVVYFIMGDYNKVEPLLLQARDIFLEVNGVESANYGWSLSNLATLYRDKGDLTKAEPLYLEVLRIYKKTFGEENINYATEVNALGMLYYKMGEYIKAEPYLVKGMELYKEINGEGSVEYATGLMNTGVLYNTLGNFVKAEPLLLKAIEIFKKVSGTSDPKYAQSLNNLASFYYSTVKTEKIEPLLLEVQQIYKKVYGVKHPMYALNLQNLSQYYTMTGEYTKAEPLLLEALEIYKNKFGEENIEYLTIYSNLGVFHYLTDNYKKAEPILKDVIRLRTKVLGETHPDCIASKLILGGLYFFDKRYDEAITLQNQALSLSGNWLKSAFTGLSESEKSYLLKQYELYYNLALNTVSAQPGVKKGEVYEKMIFRKGLVLNSSVNTKAFVGLSGDSTLKSLYLELQRDMKLISQLYSQTELQRKNSGISLDSLELHANGIEKQLMSKSSFYKDFVMVPDKSWDELRKNLAPDEALVDFVKFPYFDKKWTQTAQFNSVKYAVFISKNDATPEPVYLEYKDGNRVDTILIPTLNEINRLGRNETVSPPDDDKVIDLTENQSAIPDFYQELFAPLAEHLKGIKRVFLSLDGEFYKLNFNTIKNPKTGKYLIEEYEFIRISSPVELSRTEAKTSDNKTAVMVGYPNYDMSLDSLNQFTQSVAGAEVVRDVYVNTNTMKRYDLQELPGTKEEALTTSEILKKNGWGVESLLYNSATESNVKNVKAPAVLSISTHGYFSPSPKTDYKESFFIGTETKKAVENPMLRSGLFLTGAETFLNASDENKLKFNENGILTAFEASQLNLFGTDIVILSACETGLGEVNNGEGVFGLQRGFLGSGARSVLMSLWKVDDNATKDLMIKFIGKYAAGVDKTVALRSAQLELMKEYPLPFYWGAFVLIGR